MISHALAPVRRPDATVDWNRWIAAGFVVGSTCFLIGPLPGFVQLVGEGPDAAVFFAGSVFFTSAAALELREGTLRAHRRFADAPWWSAERRWPRLGHDVRGTLDLVRYTVASTFPGTWGDDMCAAPNFRDLETAAEWLTEGAPDGAIPESPMDPVAAMRLVNQELAIEGIPERNLATFVTTWMEPEARVIIDANLHRNFIDHAEYPRTFEVQQRCIRMLAELFNAPGETTGTSTQGSSEAIMLGALSLKWKWRQRQDAAGKPTDKPNLVFGGDVHVVWEKFCRYFDVEPRIVPLQAGKYTIGPDDVEPHIDENTIGVAAVVGTTFTGHADDVVGINELLLHLKEEKGLDVPMHIDGASGAFVWPFLYPDSKWDFRLEQVRSINASGHKFGLVYPGIGWLIFREKSALADDLVFYENYLGKTDATFTLNFSTGSSMILAQYYTFVRFGKAGYRRIMETMQRNAESLANDIEQIGKFQLIGLNEETLPLVAFNLADEHAYDEFDIAFQLSAERGWMLPAYTMPPNAQDVKMMRALVKLTLNRSLVDTLADDLAQAIETLEDKGPVSESERGRVRSGVH